MPSRSIWAQSVAVVFSALLLGGCFNPGTIIRVEGVVVDASGQRVTDAKVVGSATKRGELFDSPSETEGADTEVSDRDVEVTNRGDGTFSATARWAHALSLSVDGHKLRRIDDLGTVFLVPEMVFYESKNGVKLEVATDE